MISIKMKPQGSNLFYPLMPLKCFYFIRGSISNRLWLCHSFVRSDSIELFVSSELSVVGHSTLLLQFTTHLSLFTNEKYISYSGQNIKP